VPGDKSIAHRALLLNAVASGVARVRNLPDGADVASTRACLEALGADIRSLSPQVPLGPGGVEIRGGALRPATAALDCGNSGTTLRLLCGLLAGQGIPAILTGDGSLRRRPMRRITAPLSVMGARFVSPAERPPLTLRGGALNGRTLSTTLGSAQVKSALLLAGLGARGRTVLEVPASRDHTERMLSAMGAPLRRDPGRGGERLVLDGPVTLQAVDVDVPGDLSSAAFVLAAAALVPGSDVEIEGVGLNPSRAGFLDVLERMGADLTRQVHGATEINGDCWSRGDGEPRGRLRIRAGALHAVAVGGAEIPRLIDELPVLALLATTAHGTTTISDAGELRVKESDRIAGTAALLRALGARVRELPDGLEIPGPQPLTGAVLPATRDHRLALTGLVAGLAATGETVVQGADAMTVSFPTLPRLLESLCPGTLRFGEAGSAPQKDP